MCKDKENRKMFKETDIGGRRRERGGGESGEYRGNDEEKKGKC